MLGHVVKLFLTSGAFAAAAPSIVRRVSYSSNHAESEPDETEYRKRSNHFLSSDDGALDFSQDTNDAGATGAHCVVWGDWHYESMKLGSEDEAEELFKAKKHTEMAAVQYRGSRVVNRYQSKRLVHVDWALMQRRCNEHSSKAVRAERAEVSVGRNGAVSRDWEVASAGENSRFEPTSMARHHRNPVISSLATASSGSADAHVSTLSGKVSVLEDGLGSLTIGVAALLKKIGVDDEASNGASILQSERNGPHKAENHMKLRWRLDSLEASTASTQEKINLLETEFFGTTAAKRSMTTHGSSGHASFKLKIETLAGRIDELKSRWSALEGTSLLGEVAKLEENSARLGSDATRVFASIGFESGNASVLPDDLHKSLKSRLSALEEYASHLQRDAVTLGHELLGVSRTPPPASADLRASGPSSIKDHASSLGDKLRDLESRISSLASATIVNDVSNMENAVSSLSLRASALADNVGLSTEALQKGLALAPQGSGLKRRIAALEVYISNMQSATASLEEELAGSVRTIQTPSQKGTLSSKAKFMALQIENMAARISALEKEV